MTADGLGSPSTVVRDRFGRSTLLAMNVTESISAATLTAAISSFELAACFGGNISVAERQRYDAQLSDRLQHCST